MTGIIEESQFVGLKEIFANKSAKDTEKLLKKQEFDLKYQFLLENESLKIRKDSFGNNTVFTIEKEQLFDGSTLADEEPFRLKHLLSQ